MLLHTQKPLKFAFSRDYDPEFLSDGSFGIIGVPFDSTTTYMPGARFGPFAIREASYSFEAYNLRFEREIEIRSFDFGDVEVSYGNYRRTANFIRDSVGEILDLGLKPVVLGGEHTVSLAVFDELKSRGLLSDLTVVHMDAHMDLIDRYGGEKYSHATLMRRLHEMKPERILQLGVRSASREEVEFASRSKIKYHTASEIRGGSEFAMKSIEEIVGPVYLTVDIDVLDPAFAPATGNPLPCGLTPWEMERFIEVLASKEIIGFDIVEVAARSLGDQTSVNAAKIAYDILTLI